jgi:hypothetical protein
MAASSGNVITTLRDRWSIEQEIQAMLDIRSEQEFSDRAERVATSGEQVLPVLLGLLDQADARFVGVLGVIASLYPERQEIIDKLAQAARDLARPDRGRVSAILVLERFLEQETDPYLIATLDDPQFMATESIREMIREGEHDPRAWIEYTRSLIQEPPETIWDVMDTLLDAGGAQAVPALCLLAQEDADVVSEAAIYALGRVDSPAAAQGLQSILALLPPDRRALAERSLLKLQLRQIPIQELPDPQDRWRTLVGPPDGHGYQVVWFIHVPDERGRRKFLGLSIHEQDGIQHAYGHHDIAPDMVPEPGAPGQVLSVLLPGGSDSAQAGAQILLLETDLEYGRRLVRRGQERTIASGQPFPIEYRLMGPWLWQYRESGRDAPVPTALPADPPVSLETSAQLLYHPAFRGWLADGERLLEPAAALLRRLSASRTRPQGGSSVPPGGITDVARRYFDPAMVERLQGRLMAMSEWLERAGEARAAALALVSAQALADTPPERHPLTRAMAELGLQVMVEQLRSLY